MYICLSPLYIWLFIRPGPSDFVTAHDLHLTIIPFQNICLFCTCTSTVPKTCHYKMHHMFYFRLASSWCNNIGSCKKYKIIWSEKCLFLFLENCLKNLLTEHNSKPMWQHNKLYLLLPFDYKGSLTCFCFLLTIELYKTVLFRDSKSL